jgi:secreted trypsin-like serine protease
VVEGTYLTVSGWGVTEPRGQQPETRLQKVEVPFVATARCNAPQGHAGAVTDQMLCAGEAAGGKDACGWDSGGPLALIRPGRPPLLVGIVSWGEGCAEAGKAGVYGRVALYRKWIEETVAGLPA